MRRRDLLGLLGASLAVPGLGAREGLAGAQGGERGGAGSGAAPRLVLVELAGANDGLNTLVPYRDERYRELRPTLGLERGTLLELDAAHALHPALAPLMAAHERGELALVQGLGYPRPNRSHFRSIRALGESRRRGLGRARHGLAEARRRARARRSTAIRSTRWTTARSTSGYSTARSASATRTWRATATSGSRVCSAEKA